MKSRLLGIMAAAFILLTPTYVFACAGEGLVKSAAAAYASAARAGSGSAFVSAASRYSDLRNVSLFALGKYRKNFSKAQEAQYISLARGYMGRFMVRNARGIGGGDIKIVSCSSGLIVTKMGGSKVTFKVAGNRVSDVNIGGIWLTQALRSNFVGVLNRNNGDVNALLNYLR